MVSADNLNLDVLELIFHYLSGGDLPSVALVSRSFLAGVIPRLYSTLSFRLSHAKRYPMVMSPFSAILLHPELAVHVRMIDIRTVPNFKSKLHPVFMRECTRALKLCCNLSSFKCTVNALSPFLPSLQEKTRLQEFRVLASVTSDQAKQLIKLDHLQNLTLDFSSWNILDMLPQWVGSLKKTLTNLTLYMSNELNECVLEDVLSELPRLRGLHVVGCPKVDHVMMLRLVSHTPLLESLSFTTTETTVLLVQPPPNLHHLRNLSIDTRYSLIPSPSPAILEAILSHLRPSSPPISSFSIKLPDRKIVIGHPFIKQLLAAHAGTLKKLAFLDCSIATESVTAICKACLHLERIDVFLPVRDIVTFTSALSRSHSLRTIVDVDNHVTHGPRISLTQDNVRYMMGNVRNLRKIVSDKRIWIGHRNALNDLSISLERWPTHSGGAHWFVSNQD